MLSEVYFLGRSELNCVMCYIQKCFAVVSLGVKSRKWVHLVIIRADGQGQEGMLTVTKIKMTMIHVRKMSPCEPIKDEKGRGEKVDMPLFRDKCNISLPRTVTVLNW